MKLKRQIYILLLIGLSMSGCVKDIDFDQTENIEVNTVFQASLVSFSATVPSFLDDMGNEVLFITDTIEFPTISNQFSQDYLIQVDFNYRINNTFDRTFTIQNSFLNRDNSLTNTFNPMIVPPNTLGFTEEQAIFEADIPQFLESKRIVISVLPSGTTPLDPIQNMELNLQSAVTFYYKVTVDE